MIDRRTEQRATLQAARELSSELLHAIDGGSLGHVFSQHIEVLMQNRPFVSQCRFEDFPTVNRVFNLPKDPWIRHRAATNQNSVATGFPKLRKCAFDRRHITTA